MGNEGGHSGLEPSPSSSYKSAGGPSAIYYASRSGTGGSGDSEQNYVPLGKYIYMYNSLKNLNPLLLFTAFFLISANY